MTKENIFLTGFMGAGKSTVAACFRATYGREIIEMDQVIAEQEGMGIPRIFETKGEAYFRQRETGLLEALREKEGLVVSCGGGAVMREENVRKMKQSGKIVLLMARPETVLERVKDSGERPLLEGRKSVEGIRELMEKRREAYEAAADIQIWTDGKTAGEICREILEKLEETGENHV